MGPGTKPPGRQRRWSCRCSCGKMTEVPTYELTSGGSRSCGCLAIELLVERSVTHGRSKTAEHRSWVGMIGRCYDPNHKKHHRYGARGIVVCMRWRVSFTEFLADMGSRPGPNYSVDRRDNDGNYSCGKCEECVANGWPANCRWATREEQARNRCMSRLNADDVVKIRALVKDGLGNTAIARMFGVDRCTVADIKRGATWKGVGLVPEEVKR